MWRAAALRAGGATLVGSSLFGDGEAARACGIVGVVGHSPDAKDILLDGLAILQNRGYDSPGLPTLRGADGRGPRVRAAVVPHQPVEAAASF